MFVELGGGMYVRAESIIWVQDQPTNPSRVRAGLPTFETWVAIAGDPVETRQCTRCRATQLIAEINGGDGWDRAKGAVRDFVRAR